MQNITTASELKNAIQFLEIEHDLHTQELKEQFAITVTRLRPINLLKSSLKDITTSPHVIDNVISTVLGLATGYISNKLVVGTSINKFRKVLGSVVQLGISNLVTHNSGMLKSFVSNMIQRILLKKERI
jgi:hypothetical protein